MFDADINATFVLSLKLCNACPVSNNSCDQSMHNDNLQIIRPFPVRGPRLRSMGLGYIVIHKRFSAQPRVGNVSRSLRRNTIIASNDSIETLIDDAAREQHLRFLKFATSGS